MVVTANTCERPRAYAGLAFSYGELITEKWQRLHDEEWSAKIGSEPVPDATESAPLNIAGGALLLALGLREYRRGSAELHRI